MGERHLYTNGEDYFSAASPEEAEALWREWLEGSHGEDPADYDACEWRPFHGLLRVDFESEEDVPEELRPRVEHDERDEHPVSVATFGCDWAKHLHGFVGSRNV